MEFKLKLCNSKACVLKHYFSVLVCVLLALDRGWEGLGLNKTKTGKTKLTTKLYQEKQPPNQCLFGLVSLPRSHGSRLNLKSRSHERELVG